MEYDVLEGCLAMDRSSWMIGDRVRERALSAGARRRRRGKRVSAGKCISAGKRAPLAHYAGKCQCNSIVQKINGQLV
jgi:hypothetical protein